MIFEKQKNPEYWEKTVNDSGYKLLIDELKARYKKDYMDEIPVLKYSVRSIYRKTGSRIEFETPYFRRRKLLTEAAVLSLLYPENEEYFVKFQDLIWAICDEYSWALPAHTLYVDKPETFIDLFAAETGFMLAEICYFLGDRMESFVRARAQAEVNRRIIESFINSPMPFENTTNNWLTVCAGSVAGAFIYLAPDRFETVKPRLLKALNRYLDYIPDDGSCTEGVSYWHYGFGSYVWAADLLYQFTNGEIDLFDNPKVEALAAYAQKCFMKGGDVATFADCPRNNKVDIVLNRYLKRRYPQSVVALPVECTGHVPERLHTWHYGLRSFIYYYPTVEAEKLPAVNYEMPSSGQVIVNTENYSLFVKAGHNDEEHNHNDVGSFILSDESGQVFVDLGSGRYNNEYFSPKRYDSIYTSSRGHSVPIINGQYQKAGREYKGTLVRDGNRITVEMSAAYGIDKLNRLTRVFEYGDKGIVMTDVCDGDVEVTERFVSLVKPVINEDSFTVGNVTVKTEKDKISSLTGNFEVGECFINESKYHSKPTETIYLIDCVLKKGVKKISFDFSI